MASYEAWQAAGSPLSPAAPAADPAPAAAPADPPPGDTAPPHVDPVPGVSSPPTPPPDGAGSTPIPAPVVVPPPPPPPRVAKPLPRANKPPPKVERVEHVEVLGVGRSRGGGDWREKYRAPEQGRERICTELAGVWFAVLVGMEQELAEVGVRPMIPAEAIRGSLVLAIDQLLPAKIQLTPELEAAAVTTATTMQRLIHHKKIADHKKKAADAREHESKIDKMKREAREREAAEAAVPRTPSPPPPEPEPIPTIAREPETEPEPDTNNVPHAMRSLSDTMWTPLPGDVW